jgi:GNAT superfamily N-acetyltransferase
MLTMEQTISIASLLNSRLESAVGVLAGAFDDSPLARYCFEDQAENYHRALRAYIRLAGARRAAAGGTHLAAFRDEQLVGVAGVLPPRQKPLTDGLRAQWNWYAAVIGPQAAGRIERIEQAIELRRPAAPHCTIGEIGVLPGATGEGAGRALLDAAHDFAAYQPGSTGVYAVAASPEGVAFFERNGYRLLGRENLEGLQLFFLFR